MMFLVGAEVNAKEMISGGALWELVQEKTFEVWLIVLSLPALSSVQRSAALASTFDLVRFLYHNYHLSTRFTDHLLYSFHLFI